MGAYLPHIALTAMVLLGAVALLQRGNHRRDLLAMGMASISAVVWMVAVIAGDAEVRAGQVPHFWLAVGQGALLPTVFFVYLSVLLLDRVNHPSTKLPPLRWLAPGLATLTLLAVLIVEPSFFVRQLALTEPAAQKLHLDTQLRLTFAPGPGYYLFLGLLGFVIYQAAIYFPRIVDDRSLSQDRRSTRLLLVFAMTAVLWGAGIEILPTLLGEQAPALLRLVSAVIPMGTLVYGLTLTRALEPRQSLQRLGSWALRIVGIGIPLSLLLQAGLPGLSSMDPVVFGIVILLGIVLIDSVSLMLRPPVSTKREVIEISHALSTRLGGTHTLKDFASALETALKMRFPFQALRLLTGEAELNEIAGDVQSSNGLPFARSNLLFMPLLDGEQLMGAAVLEADHGEPTASWPERDIILLGQLKATIEPAFLQACAFEALSGQGTRVMGPTAFAQWLALENQRTASRRYIFVVADNEALSPERTSSAYQGHDRTIRFWGRTKGGELAAVTDLIDRADAEIFAHALRQSLYALRGQSLNMREPLVNIYTPAELLGLILQTNRLTTADSLL